MLRRSILVSCLLSAGALAGCVGVLGDFTVADDALPDASTPGDAGPGTTDGSTTGEDGATPPGDAAGDAPTDAPNDGNTGCASGTDACGTACFDLAKTKEHCGSCDNACSDGAGTAVCALRRCGCLNPAHNYCKGAGCFPTKTDSQHCGDNCEVCGPGSSCQAGACVCDAKFAECQKGTCTSLETDTNCGRCGNVCGGGASCVNGKCRFAQAGQTCPPWGLAYGATTDSLYWTENCAGSGAIRRCPLNTGCSTLPAALYSGGNDSLPCGVVAAKGNDSNEYVFNTDNQGPNNNRLWRALFNGTGRTDWGGTTAGGPSAIVTNGVNIWWGTSGNVYRSAVNTSGSTPVLNANPSTSTGSAPQSVALDGINVYAVRQNLAGKADGVVGCPINADCTAVATPEIQVFIGGGAYAVVSDGVNVFVSQRANGVDNVYRCPVAVGCGNGATPIWTANVAVNPGRPLPLAVDANNVYINSRSGDLLECPKNALTCASPKLLHSDVNAGSMLARDGYLYWTEGTAPRGVYRTQP